MESCERDESNHCSNSALNPVASIFENSYIADQSFVFVLFTNVRIECERRDSQRRTLRVAQVCTGGKRKKDEISVDCLDFNKKILHTAWHPSENVVAVAATNNLFLFQDKL